MESVKDGVLIHITESYNDPHRVLISLKMAVMMSNDKDVLVYMDIHAVELLIKGAKDLNHYKPILNNCQIKMLGFMLVQLA